MVTGETPKGYGTGTPFASPAVDQPTDPPEWGDRGRDAGSDNAGGTENA